MFEGQLDQVHRQGGEGENGPEKSGHDGGENQQAAERMGEGEVEPFGEAVLVRTGTGDADRDATVGPGHQFLETRARRQRCPRPRQVAVEGRCELREQGFDPVAAAGHNGDYRTAQVFLEFLGVERKAALLGEVDHVERHHRGQTEGQQLTHQVEVARQVGGIDHHHGGVGLAVKAFAAQHVAADPGLGQVELQAVGARQVDDLHRQRSAARCRQATTADPCVGGGAGEIGGFRPQPTKAVEKGGFAGIWIAEQRHAGGTRQETGCRLDGGLRRGGAGGGAAAHQDGST